MYIRYIIERKKDDKEMLKKESEIGKSVLRFWNFFTKKYVQTVAKNVYRYTDF